MNTTASRTYDGHTLAVGDVVRIGRPGSRRAQTVEITGFDPDIDLVHYRIPYATTYTAGGRYEGSYRGTGSAWAVQVA